MNNEKAREFFSAYFEGTLEPGLRQSFERKLSTDADLKAEYGSFEQTLSQLGDLKFESIAIPDDLHELVCARLDRHIYDHKRNASVGISGIWRSLALGGLAVAAIVGAIYTIPRIGGKTATAGIVGGAGTQKAAPTPSRVDFKASGDSVLIDVTSTTDHILSIESDGRVLRRVVVRANEQTQTPLENPQREAALLAVEILGEKPKRYVALPGLEASQDRSGQGDLTAFARALSAHYRVPVLLDVADPKQAVQWTLAAKDAVTAATATLSESHLSIEQRDGSLVTIADR